MKQEELKMRVEEYKEQGNMQLLQGATKEQIDNFEKSNGIKLPLKYREWLEFSDGGELFLPAGIQLYGVSQNPAIDIGNNDRPNDNYIVIGAMSFGDPIICENNSEKICIYNHEAGRIEDDEIYDDFDSFFIDLPNMLGIGG